MPEPLQLAHDESGTGVQIGSSFVTTDGTHNSPLAYTAATIAITVPNRAVEMILFPSSDLKVSEDPNIATYDIIVGGTKEAIGCSRMDTIYITRSSADGTLRFRFTKV